MLTVLLILFGVFLYWNLFHKRRNYPRGPTPLPFFGNALSLSKYHGDLDVQFIEWQKKFGDIFTIWIGETPFVMVNGYNKVVELFQNDDGRFSGRFSFDEKNDLMRGGNVAGVLHTEKQLWQEQRRFILRVFRDFGLNKNLMQERVLNEVSDLISIVNRDIDSGLQEHNMAEQIESKVGSVINSILFNYRFDESRMDEFRTIKQLMSNYVKLAGSIAFRIAQSNSKLFLYVPSIRKHVEKTQGCAKKLINFFQSQIAEHRSKCNLDSDEPPVDFVEAYLRKQRQEGDNSNYNNYQLTHVIYDLWLAGQETTSTVLAWLLIYLINNPDVQKRMHAEMDRVVGSKRLITAADRSSLFYTNAVVNEGLRLANILVVNVMHKLLTDTELEGCVVPKNTCILPQISTVLYDENASSRIVFNNPRQFNPDRFLDENGKLKTINEFIPFGIGKRQCLGEGLARMELFLFTANIFNNFEIFAGKEKPSIQRQIGGTIHPKAFTCGIRRRTCSTN
ncbi:hypothetical protein M3Y97_00783700 [Aphelenchoides bicaudatus]|nr:hypothetical protein M3Y97_00783700 [Aphelenchoides bicaudatus]